MSKKQPSILQKTAKRFDFAGIIGIIVFIALVGLYIVAPFEQTSLELIKGRGKIRLLTDNSANNYYIYRDKPMGFEYEMAKMFADHLNVQLEVITPGWNNLISFLRKNKGDFIGAGLTITDGRKENLRFSQSYFSVQQQIIHHKMVFDIDSLEDLAGKIIHVRRGTSYQTRLEQIKESGINFKIVLHDNLPTEELIRMVAEREISFTVADSNIALLNRRYYPDIRIGLAIEKEEALGWAVRKQDGALLEEVNDFLEKIEDGGQLAKLYEKYYGSVDLFDYFDLKKFHERIETRLPRYLQSIKKESAKYNFDWRLISALVYQESHFNPKAKSHTDVRGLMQVTLKTAEEMGIQNRLDPQQSLEAGVKYLHKLFTRFDDIENREQRLLFAIGSYNIGYGHIRDAQKIAQKFGLDHTQWASMKKVLPLLLKRSYYKNTEYGYARGREAVKYVNRILSYYDILKQNSAL